MKGTEMENLREIAVGAMTGHWPAYLGLNSDAERIDYLARQVERLTDEAANVDELQDQIDTLETTVANHLETIADLEAKLGRIREEAAA